MRFRVLAADYDGTLAHHGQTAPSTVTALRRLKDSGRKLVLVTGRQLDDLQGVFPELELFNRVVAENGAVLYHPSTQEVRTLAEAPPPAFAEELRRRVSGPNASVAVGKVIVATWQPHEVETLELIKDMGLELQVIFNKGAVMVLPSGVNKASGLQAALDDLGLSPRNTVGVGDAENDHAFLSVCECSVAVANALPAVKERADLQTIAHHGEGVEELIEKMLADDLEEETGAAPRYGIPLGTRLDGQPVAVSPHASPVLFAGSSGAGKSSLATAFLETLIERGYQTCIIDPEGDMRDIPSTITLGDAERPPAVSEVMELLAQARQSVAVSLVGVPLADRPALFESLLPRLLELRARTGRPHWIVVDEVHHVSAVERHPGGLTLPSGPRGFLLVTVHPNHVTSALLEHVGTAVTFGSLAGEALVELAQARGEPPPTVPEVMPERGQALAWFRGSDPFLFRCRMPVTERRRHVRKYAAGELGPDKSFYFRGPELKLNLRAHNLELFVQMAEGVDDETWLHHLQQGDYSRWFSDAIKDPELSGEARAVERDRSLTAQQSRTRIRSAIEKRYTKAA
jgi:HAD superfamily hydrolase (TIGR01484 family)